MKETIAAFLRYAAARLHPLGVRVSADVFGLSATHDLGIGQYPAQVGNVVDAIYPMTYPSHYTAGEYNLPDPNAAPGATVMDSLRDFRTQLAGRKALLVPWLQDFSLGRTYTPPTSPRRSPRRGPMDTGGFMLWNAAGLYTRRRCKRRPAAAARAPGAPALDRRYRGAHGHDARNPPADRGSRARVPRRSSSGRQRVVADPLSVYLPIVVAEATARRSTDVDGNTFSTSPAASAA